MTLATATLARPRAETSLAGWLVVGGSVLGLVVGSGVVKTFAFSVLLKPTAEGADLSRQTIGFAYLVGNILQMLATPFFGRLIELYGIRAVSIPCVLLWAGTMAAFSLLSPQTQLLVYPLNIASSLFSIAQTPIPYSKAITSWFDKNRGLALGIGVSGIGVGGVLVPQYAQYIAANYGWRSAYIALGAAIAALAVPAFLFFVRVRPGTDALPVVGSGDGAVRTETRGEIVWEALKTRRFWTLGIIFLLSIAAMQGVVGHMVALLTDRGVSGSTAASALSLAGGAIVAGRLVGGFLLDRLHGPYIAALFFVIPAVGCAAMALDATGWPLMLAAVAVGLGIGADVDVLGYLTSRYFKLAVYGTIYATLWSLVTVGTAAGPFIVSLIQGASGYGTALAVNVVVLLTCAALALTLGPYAAGTGENTASSTGSGRR